ncbi:hypothetical protein [Coxiella endosymbiont of Ornithodoros maritimus]|uniref:hypothetical protein n=1 Tax=Coxiella endosymbiont of Ornithodoros maritimus TaxID=1656172 RepID=UPI002264955B|nr:hypothetical protein [Coxiella endosymbiont of Ornithodoros maritimus]
MHNGVGDLPIFADLTAIINIVFYTVSVLDSIDITLRLFLSMSFAVYNPQSHWFKNAVRVLLAGQFISVFLVWLLRRLWTWAL